ncbi:FUSC family protein [Frigoribacterium sp. 2-23]|uniref:FUSC family protein n=1 Tax=Frigoribacterium sp. 2-23 TaxID=3415006 RepID=UPI003C6F7224
MPDPSRHRLRLLGTLLGQPRLLLAVKAALAAALSWWIAPHIPGVAANYPYYAPLGAVIAMYPTVQSSLREGIKAIIGVVIGIGLATLVIALQTGRPGVLAVAVVVGVGVLIGGIRWLGAGRDWVLTVGLFVLLLGGANSEDYSMGYIVQLGVGITVGVVVNIVLVPPLYTTQAEKRLRRVQASLADRLDEVAGVFEATWPIEDDDWERRVGVLPETLRHVRDTVQFADESRRANPRRIFRGRDIAGDYVDLVVFERIGFHLQDIAEVSGLIARRVPGRIGLVDELAAPLARATHSVAEVIRARGGDDADAFRRARRDVEALWRDLDDRRRDAGELSGGISVAVSLDRVVAALDPGDDTAPRPTDTDSIETQEAHDTDSADDQAEAPEARSGD